MTILKCSAMTCVYNKEQLCSKGDIDVTGENATSANETSCGSFRERTGSFMKDSYPIQDVTPSSAIVAHNINTMATGFSPVYQG